MGLSRLLIVVAIIWLGWFFYQRVKHNLANRKSTELKNSTISATIVKCAVCKVHVPKNEAIEVDGIFYCSNDHKNQ